MPPPYRNIPARGPVNRNEGPVSRLLLTDISELDVMQGRLSIMGRLLFIFNRPGEIQPMTKAGYRRGGFLPVVE